jgi:hypothetical protein
MITLVSSLLGLGPTLMHRTVLSKFKIRVTPLLYRRALYIKGFLRCKKWVEFVSEGAVFFEMSRAYIGSGRVGW